MSKYTITIEGDFEKGECGLCPLVYMDVSRIDEEGFIEWVEACPLVIEGEDCPLEEVKQGEWEEVEHGTFFKCSVCGRTEDFRLTNFCPRCGADMRGDKE